MTFHSSKILLKSTKLTGILALIFMLFACSKTEKTMLDSLSLSENWTFQSENMDSALLTTIPGNYTMDLLKYDLIKDPYLKDNVEYLETGREDVVYRCIFDEPGLDYSHQDLVFDGIDTYSEVSLNGKVLGNTNNMHKQYRFKLEKLKSENNILEVKISAPLDVLDSLVENSSIVLPEDFAYMRKASFQFGWDWAPETPSLGIWRDVRIEAYDDFRIISSWVETVSITDKNAEMLLVVKLNVKEKSKLFIDLQSDDFDFESQSFSLKEGENVLHIPFSTENPILWYPNGMGNPHLYIGKFLVKSNHKKYEKKLSFGVRTIKLRREKDSIGESFEFIVNGIPVFAKGANYVPQDAFLTYSDHEKLLQSCVDAHFNMLRVWGGGIYEDDRFYQLCDSLGLMIWQDYMFACVLYPGDDEFFENVTEEITQQTDRLRGFTCMALLCGNNEVSNAWFDWGWQSVFNWTEEDSSKIWHQNAYLFNELIPKILQESGVETDYLPSSPVWGWGHDESFTEGDNHYWGVWWGEEPFESYREHTGRFMSEFGFQAWPSWETLRKIHGESEIEIESDIMKSHQKHPFGDRLIREYMAKYIGETEDVKLFHEQSQQLQANGISEAIRWFRVQPKCAGSLYWQLNDCWPAISWSSIDYYGEWKSLHHAVSDAYAPYMLYAVKESNVLNCYVVSDAPESVVAVLHLSLKNRKGEELLSETHDLRTNIYNSHEVFIMSIPEDLISKKDWFLEMKLTSGNEKLAEYIFRPEL